MPIEGPKGIFRVPFLKKKEEIALNLRKRKRKKKNPKKNEKKEKTDENGPETSEPNRKHIDIKI